MTQQEHYEEANKAFDAMMAARTDEYMENAAADYAYHMTKANEG